jgi:hypothetical protein
MKVLELVLQLLQYLSELFELKKQQDDQRNQNDQYQAIRRNPRDLFDDGVLNESTAPSAEDTRDPVPRTDPNRSPD